MRVWSWWPGWKAHPERSASDRGGGASRRPRPERMRWLRRRVAIAATLALTAGLFVATSTTASAGDGGRVAAGQAIAGGNAAGDGWLITGVTSYGSAFLGPLYDPTGSSDWVWCINFGLALPSGPTTPQTVSDANAAAMAWLLTRLQYDPAALGVSDRGLSNAAGSFLVHRHYEEGNKAGVSADARKVALEAAAWPALTAEADRLWSLATANANLSAATEIQTYTFAQRTGVIGNIGIQNSRGEWIPGINFTSTLTTGAVWDTNGNGQADPGESATFSGTTGSSPITLGWVATPGVHDVHGKTDYATTRADLLALRAATSVQDSIKRGADDPQLLSSAGVRFRAVGSFQPVVMTQVVQEVVDAGQSVPDWVTFAAQAGESWIPGTLVCADGTLYGPYASEQATSSQVPAGAPIAGTARVCSREPATVMAGSDVHAPNVGVYTWNWRIDKATQENPDLITGNYDDGFFTTGETSFARLRMDLSSQVASHTQVISKGQTVVDSFTLAPVALGDLWLAPEGVPVEVPMLAEISAPVSEEGLEIVGVSQSIRFTASQFGTYTTGQDGVPSFAPTVHSGAYSVRLSVDTEALSDRTRYWLQEAYHDATDGWWAPQETFVVRMAPEISTEVAQRIFDQVSWDAPAEFPVVDHVTAWLRDAGDVWLTRDGQPVPIPADNTFWGMFDQPMTPGPLSAAPAGSEIGTERVVFTEPGTLATAGATKTTGVGFGTWTTVVEPDPMWFDGYESRFFEESETVSVRRAVRHSSLVREYSVDGGDRAFDTVTNSRLSPTAGLFDGLGGWEPDAKAASMSLYGYHSEPSTVKVPDDAVLLWQCDYADLVFNGTFEIGWGEKGECDRVEIPEPLYPDGTFYVFVFDHPGDDRHAPYTSPFNDVRERMFDKTGVTGPSVVTRAQVLAGVGEPFTDEAIVLDAPAGSWLTWRAHGPQDPGWTGPDGREDTADDVPVCTEENLILDTGATGDLVFVRGDGIYTSPAAVSLTSGDVLWVETLHHPGADGVPGTGDDRVLAQGRCGQAGETTRVVDEPWVATQAVVTHAETGEVTSIPVAGDLVADELTYGGDHAAGSYTVVDAYYAPHGQPLVCSPDQHVAQSEAVELDSSVPAEERVVTTEAFVTIPGAGTLGLVETTRGPDGVVTSVGECGDPTETVSAIALSTTIGHEDTNGDGLAGAGDELWDEIHLTGVLRAGDTAALSSTVYELTSDQVTWGDAAINTGVGNISVQPDVCTPEAVYTELVVEQVVTEAGTYATGRFTVPDAGERVVGGLTMVETATITREEETRTVTGECGAPDESIGPVYFGSGGGGVVAAAASPPGELAKTGVERLVWMLAAAALLAAVGGSASRWAEQRKHKGASTA